MNSNLINSIINMPAKPGVYYFSNSKGKILYIGKAKNLKNRVKAYLAPGQEKRIQIPSLMRKAKSVNFLITSSEKQALILENNMIKEKKPDYNICLKDDKTYKTIRITLSEKFPKLTTVRKHTPVEKDLYFGPYSGGIELKNAFNRLLNIFQLRDCTNSEFKRHKKSGKPCLKYQISHCLGPCANLISEKKYMKSVIESVSFLKGNNKNVYKYFKDLINIHSSNMDFEKAEIAYNKLKSLQILEKSKSNITGFSNDADAFVFFLRQKHLMIQLLVIRGGKIISSFDKFFANKNGSIGELARSFIEQYYQDKIIIPPEIWLNIEPEDKKLLALILSDKKNNAVKIIVPQKGTKHHVIKMAMENAKVKIKSHLERDIKKFNLQKILKKLFDSKEDISVIECYDISHTSGKEVVGGKVSFKNFESDKSNYRYYNIIENPKNDDYASLYEILKRRILKGITENNLPDLILIDGGKGQLSILSKILKEFKVSVFAASIAKESHAKSSKDKFYILGRKNPVNLPSNSDFLKKMMMIRDEAHRFTISFHRRKREKKLFTE